MREIIFYRKLSGRSPVEEFILALAPKQRAKIGQILEIVRELDSVPGQYMKKLTSELWEIRAQYGGDAVRLLGFTEGERVVVLVSAFAKKTQRIPVLEIELALQRRLDYLNRQSRNG